MLLTLVDVQEKKRKSSSILPGQTTKNHKGLGTTVKIPEWLKQAFAKKGNDVGTYKFNTTMRCLEFYRTSLVEFLQEQKSNESLLSDEDTRDKTAMTEGPPEIPPVALDDTLTMAQVVGFPCPIQYLEKNTLVPHSSNGVYIGIQVNVH